METRSHIRRMATLKMFVVVSALLTHLSPTSTTMRVITTHATNAAIFHLIFFIASIFYLCIQHLYTHFAHLKIPHTCHELLRDNYDIAP